MAHSKLKLIQDADDEEFTLAMKQSTESKELTLLLSECRKLTNVAMSALTHVGCTLCVLNICFLGNITDAGISHVALNCKNLREIFLDGLPLTDHSLRCLGDNCKKLCTISLKYCNHLTDAGIDILTKGLPLLEAIFLNHSHHLSDASLVSLSQVSMLKAIELTSVSSITDYGTCRLVGSCTKIIHLVLDYCTLLTNVTIVAVHKLTKLCHLGVAGLSNITDPAVRTLASKCLYLQFVDLSFCPQLQNHHFAKYIPLQDPTPKSAAPPLAASEERKPSLTEQVSSLLRENREKNKPQLPFLFPEQINQFINLGFGTPPGLLQHVANPSTPTSEVTGGRVGPAGPPTPSSINGPVKQSYISKGVRCEFSFQGLPRQIGISGELDLPGNSTPGGIASGAAHHDGASASLTTVNTSQMLAKRPPLPPSRQKKRIPGIVSKSHLNGFYNIAFDQTACRVPATDIRLMGGMTRYNKGQLENAIVEANYENSGLWLRGR